MSSRLESPDSPIRLESPGSPLLSPVLSHTFPTRGTRWRSKRIKTFLSTGAGRLLICTTLIWIATYVFCKYRYWRDPHSWFYSGKGVYDYQYSGRRQAAAAGFIAESIVTPGDFEHHARLPVICIGIVTVKRKRVDYLNDTIGSMLVGLTDEERAVVNVQLLFADPDPAQHPEFNKTWLHVVDHWSRYNVSDEQLEQIRKWKKADQIQEKATFDYSYILEQCLNYTRAPYVAIFEDDLIFAEGWLPKALSALASIRQKSADFLYLRLFYTEALLGWDKALDHWYTHPLLWFFVSILLPVAITLVIRGRWKDIHPDSDTSILVVIGCVALPLFITIIFMIGHNSLFPLTGLHRMDQKGCCTQALIYPRHHVAELATMLREHEPSQTDLVIDEWADEMELARYAVSPQVVQHVGLISTRGMPKRFTKETWAYFFENSNEKKLRREHEELARWGIWRTVDEDYALVTI